MNKRNVCILFGGVSPEHAVSLRSAEAVLNHLDTEKYTIIPVGITREGQWIRYVGEDYSLLPGGQWCEYSGNYKVLISPVPGEGLLCFKNDGVSLEPIDVVFPVLHGENGEDGSIQGLLQLAGIPCVGPQLAPSAVAMDKTLTKLVIDHAGILQASWLLVRASDLQSRMDDIVNQVQARFSYPVFVKPAGTGSSVGVSKAADAASLRNALLTAGKFDEKILVEEFVDGREIEVAVMGNDSPVASVCGEIDSGAEFYDYDAKYITDSSVAYVPARIGDELAEQVRELAVKAYKAIGCRGLSRVDFFVTYHGENIVFNEINTLPGFTSISMYPKLFAASGIPFGQLLDELLQLAMEASK